MTHTDIADDLTPSEVAAILGVTGTSVRVWCRFNGFGYRVGLRWRIPRRCVDEILATRAKTAASFATIAPPPRP
jgi:hypothetical protein